MLFGIHNHQRRSFLFCMCAVFTAQVGGAQNSPTWEFDLRNTVAAAFTPDGSRLLAGGGLRVALWDTVTGGLIWDRTATLEALDVEITLDGKSAILGGSTKARLVDLRDGEVIQEYQPVVTFEPGWDQYNVKVAISKDGNLVAASRKDQLSIFERSTGRELYRMPVGSLEAWNLSFLPDRTQLFVWNNSDALIRDSRTGETIREFPSRGTLFVARLSFDGTRVWTRGDEGEQLWDAQTGQLLHTFPKEDNERISGVSADARVVFRTGPLTARLQKMDAQLRNSSERGALPLPESEERLQTAISPDGKKVMIAMKSGRILVWDVTNLTSQVPNAGAYE